MGSGPESTASPSSFSEEEKFAIGAQLERLLANPFFSHSRRFPAFLRFIVNATIDGQADLLKERTIGIEIFGRSPDYDTSLDPIVRVTAAEIRKRIALYYQDSGHENELRISLPLGSYVPQFHIPGAEDADPEELKNAAAGRSRARRRRWILAAAAVLLVVAGIYGFMAWRQSQNLAFDEFWEPILSSRDPVLFCVADQTQYTAISLRDAADPSKQITLKDNLTAVVIDDLNTIIKIASVLQSYGKRYTLRGEDATTLMDLRNGPSVMVGAFDNAWTLRFLRPLRFHFANNPDMTLFSVVDAQHPAQNRWVLDRRQQITTNIYRDYAIVARFTDDITGRPTLVAAGIGRGGTIAAGEFLTDPDLLKAVRNQRPPGKVKGVEVVLSTQIIAGEPGTPKIEAVYFW